MATLPIDDPKILEEIERAILPFKHRLSPENLAIVREQVAILLATQPYPAALLRKLRSAPAQKSGVRPTEANGTGVTGASSPAAGQTRRRGS